MKNIRLGVCTIFFAVGVAVSQTTVSTTGGTTNNVPKFSGSSTIVNSAVTEVNGKVGINTTSPKMSLDVQGDSSNGFGEANFHSSVDMGVDNNQGATLFVNGPIIAQFQESLLYGTGACCNTGGLGSSGGSSLGSTADFSAQFNGAYFNANGTADGDGNTGHQINTALPSWRMALGSGTSEWPGGDNFVVGRVAAGGTYTAPTILLSLDNSGKLKVAGGLDATGGGMKHARAGGCTVTSSTGCSVILSWPGTAFIDTNYTAVCTPDNVTAINGNSGATLTITNKGTSSVTVTLQPIIACGGPHGGSCNVFDNPSMTGVECMAMHD